jgi:hypothetical protein
MNNAVIRPPQSETPIFRKPASKLELLAGCEMHECLPKAIR